MNPAAIRSQRFLLVRRGYDPEAVLSFLDEVADALEDALATDDAPTSAALEVADADRLVDEARTRAATHRLRAQRDIEALQRTARSRRARLVAEIEELAVARDQLSEDLDRAVDVVDRVVQWVRRTDPTAEPTVAGTVLADAPDAAEVGSVHVPGPGDPAVPTPPDADPDTPPDDDAPVDDADASDVDPAAPADDADESDVDHEGPVHDPDVPDVGPAALVHDPDVPDEPDEPDVPDDADSGPVAPGPDATEPTDDAEPDEPVDAAPEPDEPVDEVDAEADEQVVVAVDGPDGDDAPVATPEEEAPDEAVATPGGAAVRRALRVVQDEVLANLRDHPRGSVADWVPSTTVLLALDDAATDACGRAFLAGWAEAAPDDDEALGAGPGDAADQSSATARDALEEVRGAGALPGLGIADDLRVAVRASLQRGVDGGDAGPQLVERVAEVHRDVRQTVVTEALDLVTSAARHRGLVARWRHDGVAAVAWVLGEERRCPGRRCRANAGDGVVAPGEAFAFGEVVPPAHPGCTCTLRPAEPDEAVAPA